MMKNLLSHRIVDLCRAIFSAISLCFIIGSVCLLFFWLLSSNYYYQIKPFRSEPVTISQEGSAMESQLLIVGTGQAVFTRWIEDTSGKKVYQYPDFKINSGNEEHIKQAILYIPALEPGRYIVKGQLFYKPNPIKISEVNIVIGTIQIVKN